MGARLQEWARLYEDGRGSERISDLPMSGNCHEPDVAQAFVPAGSRLWTPDVAPHDLDAPRNQAEPLLHENEVLLATDEHG